jgi:hypothetical protein
MRVREIIRALLDIIDAQQSPMEPEDGKIMVNKMIDNPQDVYTSEPHEVYSSVEDITTLAGGGPNKPKHPADIRIKDPRGFE